MKAFQTRIFCSSHVGFAVVAAVVLIGIHNWRFWQDVLAVVRPASAGDVVFIVSLALTLVYLHAGVFLLIPGRRSLQLIAMTFFMLGAVAGYFRDSFGVIVDTDMIRNVALTDAREAGDFLTPHFVLYIFLLGLVPAFLVARVELAKLPLPTQIMQRLRFAVLGLLLASALAFPVMAHYASFLREHKEVRKLINPAEPIYAAFDYWLSTDFSEVPVSVEMSNVARRRIVTGGEKPLVLFLVIGETAREQNFQLGSYRRPTNPELSQIPGVFYFENVRSCGTSTAVSLPCMFSHEGRGRFDLRRAAHQANLLDALAGAGWSVQWRENNSGSQGISARVRTIEYSRNWPRVLPRDTKITSAAAQTLADSSLCSTGVCFDEIMLVDLADELKQIDRDTAIVFHPIGSHGPGYWQRYPERFEFFKPTCKTTEIGRCSHEEIVNAYDNTIRYADHNLAEQIRLLGAASRQADSVLIYVSDHGESLGEKGLYLHGAPFFMAPDEQTRVPFVLWMSDGYRKRFAIRDECVVEKRSVTFTHDNLYHTVIGALGLINAVYDPARDILAQCRGNMGPAQKNE